MKLNVLLIFVEDLFVRFIYILATLTFALSACVHAGDWTYPLWWGSGANVKKSAGSCIVTTPDTTKPMTVARTLVVSDDIPVGSTLFSWSYGNFMNNFHFRCNQGTGVLNTMAAIVFNAAATGVATNLPLYSTLNIRGTPAPTDTRYYKTSINGIGLRLTVKSYANCVQNPGVQQYYQYMQFKINGSTIECPAPTAEYVISPSSVFTATTHLATINLGSEYKLGGSVAYGIKADLVKIALSGSDNKTGQLSLPMTVNWSGRGGNSSEQTTVKITNYLEGNAIKIVSPSCQLDSIDHKINMNSWLPRSTDNGTGPNVPIPLAIKCSGKTNVNISFSDTGPSPTPSSNNVRNVTLYNDSNVKINGLELELKHSNIRVNMGAIINTGSHGTRKTTPESTPLFHSSSEVKFTANYIQNSAITVNNRPYSGPLKGNVNIVMTFN